MKKMIKLTAVGMLALLLAACGQGRKNPENEMSVGAGQDPFANDNQTSVAVAPESEAKPVRTRLKEPFAEYEVKVGVYCTAYMIDNDFLGQLILEHCNSITLKNAMMPEYLFNRYKSMESGELTLEFNRDMLSSLEWARQHNIAVRGHALVSSELTPAWIFYEGFDTENELVGREEMLARMESYFKQLFGALREMKYTEIIYAYDVVSDALNDDGTLKDNYWRQTIGDDYLWYAFYYANQYAPRKMKLYYNDSNEQFKTDKLIELVNTVVDAGGNHLIDGLGLEAHLYTGDDLDAYFQMLDAFGAAGIKVEITELEVALGTRQETLEPTDENLRIQGQFYYNLIAGILERVAAGTIKMDSLSFGGFADGLSERREGCPLLYDYEYEPKYAFYGALQRREDAGFE